MSRQDNSRVHARRRIMAGISDQDHYMMTFFYRDDCPLCRTFRPTWHSVQRELQRRNANVSFYESRLAGQTTPLDVRVVPRFKLEQAPPELGGGGAAVANKPPPQAGAPVYFGASNWTRDDVVGFVEAEVANRARGAAAAPGCCAIA